MAKSISVKGRASGSKKSRVTVPAPQADPSLTTITEEPPSWRSSAASLGQQSQHSRSAGDAQPLQSIIVQPEVTVETAAGNTKVTAHAHIKVELFTVAGRGRTTSYHSSGDGSS